MRLPLQIADSRKPTSDSGNMLAAIVVVAGISLLLQFKQIRGGMLISAISQQQEACCR